MSTDFSHQCQQGKERPGGLGTSSQRPEQADNSTHKNPTLALWHQDAKAHPPLHIPGYHLRESPSYHYCVTNRSTHVEQYKTIPISRIFGLGIWKRHNKDSISLEYQCPGIAPQYLLHNIAPQYLRPQQRRLESWEWLEGWGYKHPSLRLVVDAGCLLGPQLGLLTETMMQVLPACLLGPSTWCLGSENGSGTERTRRKLHCFLSPGLQSHIASLLPYSRFTQS